MYKKAHIVTSPVIFKSTPAISNRASHVFVFLLPQEDPDCVGIPLDVSSAGIGALRLPLPLCVSSSFDSGVYVQGMLLSRNKRGTTFVCTQRPECAERGGLGRRGAPGCILGCVLYM